MRRRRTELVIISHPRLRKLETLGGGTVGRGAHFNGPYRSSIMDRGKMQYLRALVDQKVF